MLNVYTWKWEHPHGSLNLIFMGLALTIVGVIFVSIPRYFIELQWLHFQQRQQNEGITECSPKYVDIRPFGTKLAAHLLDTLIIGGFIFSFWQ